MSFPTINAGNCDCRRPDIYSSAFGQSCLGCGQFLGVIPESEPEAIVDRQTTESMEFPSLPAFSPTTSTKQVIVNAFEKGEDFKISRGTKSTERMFKHEPLQVESDIRLINLLPSGRCDEEIYCHIVHVNFNQWNGKYEALSYTWGDSTQTEIIKCGEALLPLRVTRNCADALRSLRRPHLSRLLWIDSICIDQSNSQEKTHQVALMGSIYSGASRVLIHLGSNKIVENFLKILKDGPGKFAAELYSTGELKSVTYRTRRLVAYSRKARDQDAVSWLKLVESGSQKGRKRGNARFSCLFPRVFTHARSSCLFPRAFTHADVYQHRVSDRMDLRLPSAHVQKFLDLPWFRRVWVIQEVVMARKAFVIFGHRLIPWDHLSIARMCSLGPKHVLYGGLRLPPILNLNYNEKKPFKDLSSLLHMARTCNSTDPRDRIYALLGLLRIQDEFGMVADYQKSEEQLYTEFAVRAIVTYNHLGILLDATASSCISGHGLRPMIPSWVLDLKLPLESTSLACWRPKSQIPFAERPVASFPKSIQCKAMKRVREMDFCSVLPMPLGLKIKITRLDVIEEVVAKAVSGKRYLLPQFELATGNGKGDQVLDHLMATRFPHTIQDPLDEKIQRFSATRAIVETRRGSFAICNIHAEYYDVICAVLGISVPVVLRWLSPGECRLLGECYLHSFRKFSFTDYEVESLETYSQSLRTRMVSSLGRLESSGSIPLDSNEDLVWEEVWLK